MELKSFSELQERLKARGDKPILAIAGADDSHVLEPVIHLYEEGMLEATLVGNSAKIRELLEQMNCSPGNFEIMDPDRGESVSETAVKIIREGKADYLMKGMLETADFMRPVVNSEHGLGTGKIMSHFGMHEIEGYKKVISITDAAVCTLPDVNKKKQILLNVFEAYRKLGYTYPKAACLCCKETVDPKLQDTVDAAELHEMCMRGEFGEAFVSGPISYDIAMDKEVAEIKKYPDADKSEDFDILLAPNIHAGNILGKCLCVTCHAAMGGVVMGARVPIILTSRGATMQEKINSIVLAAAIAGGDINNNLKRRYL